MAELAARFGLSESRIKQIAAAPPPLVKTSTTGIELAEERMKAYRDLLVEVRAFTGTIPETQPAAKVGAYRLIFDVLRERTSLEQKLGYLPRDLSELGHKREFAETIHGILIAHDVPAEVRQALLAALEGDRWAE